MPIMLSLAISLIGILTAHLSWADPLIFGPQRFIRQAGEPEREMVTFEVSNSAGTFWLQVSIGEGVPKAGRRPGAIEMQNMVTSGRIWLNRKLVAKSGDFDIHRTKQAGFTKDVTFSPVNTLEVELRGKPSSFITVEIRQAEPNVTVGNSKGDLTGSNSDARLMGLCYKVEALNARGKVVRKYEPICVPKFVEKQRQGFDLHESPDNYSYAEADEALRIVPQQLTAFDPLKAAPSATINELCLSDDKFTDFGSSDTKPPQAIMSSPPSTPITVPVIQCVPS
jgi:hypothetical protein